jgi:hypothetical protein
MKRGVEDTKQWLGKKIAQLLFWVRRRVDKANLAALTYLHKHNCSPATAVMPRSRGTDRKKLESRMEHIAEKCGF